MKHVVVLDTDATARHGLSGYLVEAAFQVSEAASFQELQRLLPGIEPDLLVIDVKADDDFEMVRRLAARVAVPIVILSGSRIEEDDKVRGLEAGAVDYITKPLAHREFVARLRAAMREKPLPRMDRDMRSYSFAGCTLWVRQRNLCRPGAADVKLTVAEFNLLVAFLRAPRKVLSREQLLAASRVNSEEIFDRSLDALILRLRRKVELDPANPQLIKTARGAGYRFESDVILDDRPRRR